MILALQGQGVVPPGRRFHDRARRQLFFSDLLHHTRKCRFLLLRGEKLKVVGSQHVVVNMDPVTLAFSGEPGHV